MDDVCVEKRIFFRLISGLHTSITVHIARDYYDEATGVWGPSLDVYRARVAAYDGVYARACVRVCVCVCVRACVRVCV